MASDDEEPRKPRSPAEGSKERGDGRAEDDRALRRDKKKSGRGSRSRSRSRDRRDRDRSRRSRSRSRDKRKDRRSRSRSRDRHRSSRRSRSYDKRKDSRSRSRSRGRRDRRRWSRDSRSRSRSPRKPPGGAPGSDPFAALRQPAPQMANPAEIQRLWQEQQIKAREMVLQQQAVSARTAATKSQREIHVGNLVPGAVSEAMLSQIFNTALAVRFPNSGVPGMEPVVKVQIHKDGRYGFIEFRTPEMATAAIDLNGQVQFLGQAMSINRPSAYMDPLKIASATALAGASMAPLGGVGIAPALGGLPGMGLPGVGLPGAPAASIPGLSPGMAFPGPPPMPGSGVPPAVPPPGAPPPMPMLASASPGGGSGQSPLPTPAICVSGMVGADVLASDAEYAEVLGELREECEKFAGPGSVLQAKVPRPPQPEMAPQLIGTGNYGKAFVFFRDIESAAKAQAGIHGRTFAGQMLQVIYVTPDHYASIP